jgi:hypothetical protein
MARAWAVEGRKVRPDFFLPVLVLALRIAPVAPIPRASANPRNLRTDKPLEGDQA